MLVIVQPVLLLLFAVYALLLTICRQLHVPLAKTFCKVASTALIVLFVWAAKEATVLFRIYVSHVQRVFQHVRSVM